MRQCVEAQKWEGATADLGAEQTEAPRRKPQVKASGETNPANTMILDLKT